jgi:hypothetical protein
MQTKNAEEKLGCWHVEEAATSNAQVLDLIGSAGRSFGW